jgi:hypothetical protein
MYHLLQFVVHMNFFNGLLRLNEGLPGGKVLSFANFHYLTREGLHDTSKYPDGNITFTFYTSEPKFANIFGESYGVTIQTLKGETTIFYESIPENYGEITNSEHNFLHYRIPAVRIYETKIYNETYTNFRFSIEGEFLNYGEALIYSIFSYCSSILLGIVNLGYYQYNSISTSYYSDSNTNGYYPAFSRSIIKAGFFLYFHNMILDNLTNGNISLWFDLGQLVENTYNATIFSNNGELHYIIPLKPGFWNYNTLINQSDYSYQNYSNFSNSSFKFIIFSFIASQFLKYKSYYRKKFFY